MAHDAHQPDAPHPGEPTPTMGGPRTRHLTREQVARLELGHTRIGRATAWLLVLGLLATVVSVPLGQHAAAVLAWLQAPEDREAAFEPPAVWGVTELAPDPAALVRARSWGEVQAALPAPERLKRFETAVEENSALAAWLLPRVQWALIAFGGTGNEQAVTGEQGWLFYQPGIDYLTHGPFLDPAQSDANDPAADRVADPVATIIDLRDQLAERGIELILLPTPVKPQVHPERVTARYRPRTDGLLQNPAYATFRERLAAAGVHVLDPAPTILAVGEVADAPAYLKTDTHWRPATMQRVAANLARTLRGRFDLPAGEPGRYRRSPHMVTQHGDIVTMLRLPEHQQLYPPERVTIQQVRDTQDAWFTADGQAPVLLLGDSFSNIYSQAGLGWGEHAGLAAQLAVELGLGVDRIVINDGGAHSTRQRLAAELARGRDRLASTQVVVWQFAQRELLIGDWRRIELPEPAAGTSGDDNEEDDTATDAEAADVVIEARIEAIGRPPEPGSVAYADCLVAVHLRELAVVQGEVDAEQVLVLTLGMTDNEWTSAARWEPGQRVRLSLVPWDAAEAEHGATQQRMTGTDADFTVTSWWYAPIEQAEALE
ncbi:MAG: hypothetical protein WD534_05490 [Phycisphaeraceae bacterium]